MKFKVGDKVRCIESINDDNGGPKKGDEYIIVSYNDIKHNGIGIALPNLGIRYSEEIKNGLEVNWGTSCFELVKEKKVIKPALKKYSGIDDTDKGWGF